MIEKSILNKLEGLGYYALPSRHEHGIGHRGLLILLRQKPAGSTADFDPQTIRLRLLDWNGKAHWTTFKYATPYPMSRILCPGTMTIMDWTRKRATFFIFGGSLEMAVEAPDKKVYVLHSQAPILELTGQYGSPANTLAAETEAIWSRLQASWQLDEEAFWHRLTTIPPLSLFGGVLQIILKQSEQTHPWRQGSKRQFYQALQHEKRWLQKTDQWSESVPPSMKF